MKISLSTVLAGFGLIASFITPMAHATPIQNTTGLTGTFQTETFDTNFGNDSAAASQFAGIHFSKGAYISDTLSTQFPNVLNSSVVNYSFSSCILPSCPSVTISFDNVQSGAAFAFVANDGSATFSAYLGGSLVESFTSPTLLATGGQFYGFDGISFDSIVIDAATVNNAFLIDNLQSKNASAVPLPGSIALLLAGAIGVTCSRRRANSTGKVNSTV
jgi:hypothetical protein